jgi:hypothetical protein
MNAMTSDHWVPASPGRVRSYDDMSLIDRLSLYDMMIGCHEY